MEWWLISFLAGSVLIILWFFHALDCAFDCRHNHVRKKISLYSILAIIGSIIIIIDLYSVVAIFNSPWTYQDKPNAVEKIVGLSDNNMVTGQFYIRRGYIEQDLWYQYMVALDDGGFVSNKLKSSDTTLYYSDGNYRVEWWSKSRKWLWLYQTENYHKIFIPYGSITDDYSIDLK